MFSFFRRKASRIVRNSVIGSTTGYLLAEAITNKSIFNCFILGSYDKSSFNSFSLTDWSRPFLRDFVQECFSPERARSSSSYERDFEKNNMSLHVALSGVGMLIGVAFALFETSPPVVPQEEQNVQPLMMLLEEQNALPLVMPLAEHKDADVERHPHSNFTSSSSSAKTALNFTERLNAIGFDVSAVPEHLTDRFTFELINDPVVCTDAHTYDRESVLRSTGTKSHITGQPLSILIKNQTLKSEIEEFVSKQEKAYSESHQFSGPTH